MKKRFLLMGAAAALITATMVGGTLAANQAESITQDYIPAAQQMTKLTVSLSGDNATFTTSSDAFKASKVIMPGDTITFDEGGVYDVTNTGSIGAYVRVQLHAYWGDEKGPDYSLGETSVEVTPNDGWIKADATGLFSMAETADGAATYYCTSPVAVSGTSAKLVKEVKIPVELDNKYQGKTVYLIADASAVQFAGAEYADLNKDGILAAWGCSATLGADGSITSLSK